MTFLTIGSTKFQFDRLLSSVDRVLCDLKLQSKLIAQIGYSKYRWSYRNVKQYQYLHPRDMIKIIKKSDKIITHGGFGTMYLTSQYSQIMPLLIGRLAKFNEHVDNHQKFFLEIMKRKIPKKLRDYFFTNGDLEGQIKSYLSNKPQKNILGTYLFDEKSRIGLINKLQKYIESL